MEINAEDVKNIRSLAVCKEILRQAIELNDQLNDELRRQKYKRCLRIISYLNIRIVSSFLTSPEYTDWLNKWKVRWLKIAEQFKEAK